MSTYFARSHHHTSTDSVERIRSDTSASCDSPTEQERGQEITLKRTNEEDGLNRIVHSEVQTTIDNYTEDRGTKTTVETRNTVTGEGLLININQAVELSVSTALGILGIIGETGTGIVQGVHEEKRCGTSGLHNGQRKVYQID